MNRFTVQLPWHAVAPIRNFYGSRRFYNRRSIQFRTERSSRLGGISKLLMFIMDFQRSIAAALLVDASSKDACLFRKSPRNLFEL